MRTLSRPMFNMGGPIKEGVMHGIREPYRGGGKAALVGNPIFPKTGGRAHHAETPQSWWQRLSSQVPKGGTTGTTGTIGQTGSKAANLLAKAKAWKIPTDVQLGRGIFGGLKKAYSMAPKQGFLFRNPLSVLAAGAYFGGTPTPVDKKYGITSRWENIAPMFGDTTGIMEKKFKRNIEEGANPNNWWRYDAGKHGPRKEHPLYDPDKVSVWPWDKGATETAAPTKTILENITMEKGPPGGTQLPSYTDPDKANKLAAQKKEDRLNNLLDIMGYDKSKSTAIHRALVDASQIVTQAPGGETLDITKDIISPIIAATGKRLEKPADIREAVGLMMAKGEIEKDIFKSKGTASEQAIDALAAASGKSRKYIANAKLGIANSPSEAKAQLAKLKNTRITSDNLTAVIQQYADDKNIPFKKQITTDQKNEVVGKGKKYASIVDMMTDLKLDPDGADDGLYVVGTSIIEVTGGLPKLKG